MENEPHITSNLNHRFKLVTFLTSNQSNISKYYIRCDRSFHFVASSKVLFVATANSLSSIPGPLRDRMEVIEIPGYTDDEKVAIAKEHLVPKQVKANGLKEDEVQFTQEALNTIGYTKKFL